MLKQENPEECALTILTLMLASKITGISVDKIENDQIREAATLVKQKRASVMMMFGKSPI